MVYYDTRCPEHMSGEMLDDYLLKGWYRINQTIIATDIIYVEERFLPVFWLRIDLKRYRPGKAARRISARNRNFSAVVKPFAISGEIDELYAAYKASVDFRIPDTIAGCLLAEDSTVNIYDTSLIEIRDGRRLVAAGYFDSGHNSTAGILHIFHPDYKRQSPGKYLMLYEIDLSIQNNKKYYYPGYICTGTSKYDYKLFPDINSTEIYVRDYNEWYPVSSARDSIMEWGRMVTELINNEPVSSDGNNQ